MKVVKDSLHKLVNNPWLNYDELITVLTETEVMVNSRPLTYLSEEGNTEAITPFHLLHGRNIAAAREMNLIQRDVNTGDLENRVKYIRLLLSHFWKRFYNEYTVALRERMMYDKTKRSSDKLAIGDAVVFKDNSTTPRSKWKHGRVKSLIKGRDNIVRGAVLTSSTNGKLIDISRPFQKPIPLEVCNSLNVEPANEKQQIVISERLRRNVARTGELVRRTAVLKLPELPELPELLLLRTDFYFLKTITYLLR